MSQRSRKNQAVIVPGRISVLVRMNAELRERLYERQQTERTTMSNILERYISQGLFADSLKSVSNGQREDRE